VVIEMDPPRPYSRLSKQLSVRTPFEIRTNLLSFTKFGMNVLLQLRRKFCVVTIQVCTSRYRMVGG
jgi:hypothetical protein